MHVGQAEHDVEAGKLANEPSGQTLQAELADALEKDPGPHGTHFVAYPPTEKNPGLQGRNPLANPMLKGPSKRPDIATSGFDIWMFGNSVSFLIPSLS